MTSGTPASSGLRRDVGLTLIALYATGSITGAGIYVLVSKLAGESGRSVRGRFALSPIICFRHL